MLRNIPRPGRRELLAFVLLVVEIIFFSFMTDNFATLNNAWNILRNATDLAIISIGMTLVIISGGMDISAGAALGLVALVVGRGLEAGLPTPVLVLIALGMGALLGTINGLIITYGRIADIIATLGTNNILRAAIFALLGGRWITGLPGTFNGLVLGKIWGIPVPVFLILAAYAIFLYITTFRRFGQSIYAVGNNSEAAKLAGINFRLTKIGAYAVMGLLTGVAALVYLGRMGSVEITVGLDIGLRSVAAVVIGGTAITGGRGSLVGTLIGVLFIDVMKNGLVMLGVPSIWDRALVGLLIVLSVTADRYFEVQTARARLKGRAASRHHGPQTPSVAAEGR